MGLALEENWRSERRLRLLDAAARVFSRRGYDDASMDEIALEAGMGKPTLYRYFPSKASLFAAVFVEALDALEAKLGAVLDAEPSFAERIFGLVRALLPTFRDHLVPLRFLGEGAAAVDQSRRRIFRDRRARIAGFLARAVRDGVRTGEARAVDPDRIAHLTIGMIWGGAAAITADDDEVAREISGLILRGVADGPAVPPAAPEPLDAISAHSSRTRRIRAREATSA
ncbi:TetR/AcrR family transcriptional regulator [Enterovirga sp.]|jgi:AcrR family transcriptional regulator|uniref:TetR/AcrR family transcriptional regulator n=1 Tax=Enterovirga sp. TaxID=2026350 RepID=UPI00261CE13F|nr:TetR/AcrR family transcriptional regulator [Enterovirga sp.]MDB5592251.1 TetR/AcrR family transcriptional regulator [Enterovirga sp.]